MALQKFDDRMAEIAMVAPYYMAQDNEVIVVPTKLETES